MQCPRCAGEKIGVIQTRRNKTIGNKSSILIDSRDCICQTCNLTFPLESKLTYVYVYDTETMRKAIVDIETYKRDYLPFEGYKKGGSQ